MTQLEEAIAFFDRYWPKQPDSFARLFDQAFSEVGALYVIKGPLHFAVFEDVGGAWHVLWASGSEVLDALARSMPYYLPLTGFMRPARGRASFKYYRTNRLLELTNNGRKTKITAAPAAPSPAAPADEAADQGEPARAAGGPEDPERPRPWPGVDDSGEQEFDRYRNSAGA